MNKTVKILIGVAVAVVVILIAIFAFGSKSASSLKISSAEDLTALVDQIYEGVSTEMPMLMTMPVDTTDVDAVKAFTGLNNAENIEYAVVSEPMMNAQAYSMVLVKVKAGANANAIAKEMNDLPDSLKGIVKGGGSLTALPIIETQAGDVSAYIPTNVISITDGQIFLDGDLFNSGVRPAINVGISVSRVGGNAQIKSMKKVAGTLKLDQAAFRELEAFAKFGSDLDAATLNVIEKGKRNVEILKQSENDPYTVEDQIAIIYAGSKNLMRNVPVEKVKEFERDYLEMLNLKHRDTLDALKAGKLTDEAIDVMVSVANDVSAKYKK